LGSGSGCVEVTAEGEVVEEVVVVVVVVVVGAVALAVARGVLGDDGGSSIDELPERSRVGRLC